MSTDDDATTAADKRDMANKFGGTYLQPGKLYRSHDEVSVSNVNKSIKQQLDDAEREDHMRSTEKSMKGAVDMRSMSLQDKVVTAAKMNPLIPIGLVGSIVTLLFGVQATFKGQANRSYRLMHLRYGFGLFTFGSMLGWQHLQTRIYRERLIALKKELLEELGEDENSLNML